MRTHPKDPIVSVVMSVYNDGPFVSEAVQSILNQTWSDFEFIIVDDGAIDDSVARVQEFRDERIRLIRQSNAGLAAALNRGIREARGEFIARQDADDISEPERLMRQAQFLQEHREVGLVGCSVRLIDEGGQGTRVARFPVDDADLQKDLIDGEGNPFMHGSVMMRKAVVEAAGMYRVEFRRAQDIDLWLRIAELAPIANLPEVLYTWRHRRTSVGAQHWIRHHDFARLARWCAVERRRGRPEPELSLRGVTRDWFTKLTERLRVVKDPDLVYEFMSAQDMLLQGQGAEARPILYKLVRRSPITLYAWLMLLLTFLPVRVAKSLWHGLRSIYRAGTWKR
jgi:glycosyltransferase involved in cell wall biosynthesis